MFIVITSRKQEFSLGGEGLLSLEGELEVGEEVAVLHWVREGLGSLGAHLREVLAPQRHDARDVAGEIPEVTQRE